MEVNGSLLRTVDPSFQGAHLVITSSQDDRIENITYTIKEVNAFFACHSYVVAAISSVEGYQLTYQTWQRAFGTTELFVAANTSNPKGTINYV